jgi:hypothetical protein
MPRRIYAGPIDAINTELDGVEMRVERGEAVTVSEETAAKLDDQPSNWVKPRTEVKELPAPSPASPHTQKDGD